MEEKYSRVIAFENIQNFRDLGGYKTPGGRTVAWRRLFRSAELHRMTPGDLQKLREEIKLTSIIDLRAEPEVKRGLGLISSSPVKHYNISLIADGGDRIANERRYSRVKSMGEFYLDLLNQRTFGGRIVEALEVIAEPSNLPLVFHCSAGKDRTGILAAIVLALLDVNDADIINDYAMSAPFIEELYQRIKNDASIPAADKALPEYFWTAAVESMNLFLDALRQDYGSVKSYIEAAGADPTLKKRLEKALLD
jgi:protein-tyrosine phosphatase